MIFGFKILLAFKTKYSIKNILKTKLNLIKTKCSTKNLNSLELLLILSKLNFVYKKSIIRRHYVILGVLAKECASTILDLIKKQYVS